MPGRSCLSKTHIRLLFSSDTVSTWDAWPSCGERGCGQVPSPVLPQGSTKCRWQTSHGRLRLEEVCFLGPAPGTQPPCPAPSDPGRPQPVFHLGPGGTPAGSHLPLLLADLANLGAPSVCATTPPTPTAETRLCIVPSSAAMAGCPWQQVPHTQGASRPRPLNLHGCQVTQVMQGLWACVSLRKEHPLVDKYLS